MSQRIVPVLACYSEAGGVTKTTTAVSLAMAYATAGQRTLLIDLDPRQAASRLTGVEPSEAWRDVSAILGNEEPDGYAAQLALPTDPSRWHELLHVIPSSRQTSVVEAQRADHQEMRLARSLVDAPYDVVVIDSPNRQGGPLTLNALQAANIVIYAVKPDADGQDGVAGAQHTVQRFIAARALQGAAKTIHEHIVIGAATDTVQPRIERHAIESLRETYGDLVLSPPVPHRTIVREARATGDFYGRYPSGQVVFDAYQSLARQIISTDSGASA